VVWSCGNGTGGGTCDQAADTGDIDTTVNLPVGATVTFTIIAKSPDSGAFVNVAIVSPPAGLIDTDPSNNPSGAVIRQISDIADMAVTLSGLPGAAAPNALISGTVTCANVGTAPARQVSCALTGGTLAVCRVDGAPVTLPLATLAAGPAIVCGLTATAPASGSLLLTATTDAENDSDPGNNRDEAVIVVKLPLQLPTLDKAFTPAFINTGQALTLSIFLGNDNASALLPSAAFVDTLPAGVTVISPVNLSGTTCTIGSVSTTRGSVSYANGAAIPPGGCFINVQVTGTVAGKYVNQLAVGDLQTNGGGNEDPAEADLYVDPADLDITKTLTTAGPYAPGQVVSFTIVGVNNGPDPATGVVITDVPANLTI
jgi:large repetitive protein